MLISKQAVGQYLARELQDYSWLKSVKKKELWKEVVRVAPRPRFKTQPWAHQLACFLIGVTEPRWLFNLDMGAGKTKLMLDLFSYQRQAGKAKKRMLVLVPRLINLDTWREAAHVHSSLSCCMCTGGVQTKRELLLEAEEDVVVIDYHGLQLATSLSKTEVKARKQTGLVRDDKIIAKLRKRYDFLVLDEVHKVKNSESQRYGVVNQLAKTIPFVYGLTGTLLGRDVEEVVPQFKLVDRGDTFPTLGMFRAAFCKEVADYWAGTSWVMDSAKIPDLHRFMKNASIRYETEECVELPTCSFVQIRCSLTSKQKEAYEDAMDGFIRASGDVKKLEGAWIKLREIAAGYLRWNDDIIGKTTLHFDENPKLDALESLLDSCGDSKMVISHEYTESGAIISALLTKLKIKHVWLYGGSKDPIGQVRKFVEDPSVRVFLMNSESGGTGTDGLQKVARYLVFFESPSSPFSRKQTERRIHRPGQKHPSVIYDLVVANTEDEQVLAYVQEGKDLHDSVMSGVTKRDKKR